uniref:PSP1 C-terminal domain-containing protein n=1 Tax=Chlorobium chlorochromatii (strain CaD3) TaxID=340177 RepID=Q3AQR3_CHLCH
MSNVVCSCLLGDNAHIRLRLSQLLHSEVEALYSNEPPLGEGQPEICEVELQGCRRDFFVNASGVPCVVGQQVVVESDGGYDYGLVYSTGAIARKKLQLKGLDKQGIEWSSVVRVADEHDARAIEELQRRQAEIREVCLAKIKRHELDLKLVDVELRMDQQKLSVYYTSSHRVDFRMLVRDLAGEFKARIQMVQITTREEARRANAFGPCGNLLCCSSWIQKIQANPFADKTHYSENPSNNDSHTFNMTGLCNRPKCCIGFTTRQDKNGGRIGGSCCSQQQPLPTVGTLLSTPDGQAQIAFVDAQKKLVVIRYQHNNQTRRFPLDKFNALFTRQ